MQKTILLTGATDGIGLETAKLLVEQGHHLLLHGRNATKLAEVEKSLADISSEAVLESYVADLSRMSDIEAVAKAISEKHAKLDVLINNAGILKTSNPLTEDGLDVRFVVNTLAPYLLTQRLLPLLIKSGEGRIVNLSSAAQASVDVSALTGQVRLADDFQAYAQSKLAITMWSRYVAANENRVVVIAVNPGSLLGTKMVKDGFGMEGKDIGIGADILVRAALSEEFANASGQYFDNDAGQFAQPHADALDTQKTATVVQAIENILGELT